ncbi:hypothetical protein GCM10011365_19450 [Marinicella pacifica]|uniref:DUF11 domain-containing protein n=2 Tax=Marinicella pacifica TaxID=1171543 RepID=A0A917CUQ3_9GAMM|nr:DUF11 domain-containing protein [Marinicella pacifica]GGF98255.1 hypothetical protein GCM10011365_19450 [Marinicella pacifica]
MKRIGLLILLLMAPLTLMAETICAIVKIEIRQELSLERQAFDAKMVITNGLDLAALENLSIDVLFRDADGNPVLASSDQNNTQASFFITLDRMEGVNAVDGTGVINAGEAAEIHWLIIPAPGSGGEFPQGLRYGVAATVSYTYGEESQVVNVSPDYIQVKPTPLLTLDYFIPKDVFGDDPLTPEVEAVTPFDLGLRIYNAGFGEAKQLKIESAQPEIIENEQGLLIDFTLLGSSLNDASVTNSLLADVGLLPAGQSAVVSWLMSTSLNGEFISFEADFVHADELGGALTSLIDSVNTHYLFHRVVVDYPGRDTISDFLALDGSQYRVYESSGTQADVISLPSGIANTGVVNGQQTYALTLSPTAGPIVTQVTDPYQGQPQVITAVRSDGKVLPERNVWQYKEETDPGVYAYYIALFDVETTGAYQLIINGGEPNEAPVINVSSPQTGVAGTPLSFDIEVTDANAGDVLSLVSIGAPAASSVAFVSGSTWRFSWFPELADIGTHQFILRADDGQAQTDASVTVVIEEPDFIDTDGDGMDDDWERDHFGDLSQDAEGDYDQDSATNLEEHDHGGNPIVEDRPLPATILNPVRGAIISSPGSEFTIVNAQAAVDAALVYEFELYESELSETPLAQATVSETAVQTSWQHGVTLNENSTYFWRVRPFDGATPGLWSYDSFTLSATDEPPYGCALAFPDNQVVTSTQPSLSVMAAHDDDSDSLKYRFRVFSDDLMTEQAVDSGWLSEDVLDTSYDFLKQWQPYATFENLDTYYWQVSVKDDSTEVACGDSAFTVDTALTLPYGYAVDSQLMDAVIGTDIELIIHHDNTVPSEQDYLYDIQIDKTLDFSSTDFQDITDQVADSNQQIKWQLSNLDENSVYYWRAKARINTLSGDWVYGRLTVRTDTSSPVLVQLNPSNLSWVDHLRPVLSFQADTGVKKVSHYLVEVFTDEAATQLLHSLTTDHTEVVVPELTDRNYYYWRVTSVYEDSSQGTPSQLSRFYTINSGVIHIPEFEFLSLQQAEQNQGLNYTIEWVDSYDGGNADIELFYDTDNQGEAGILIASGLSEDDFNDSYNWDLMGVGEGNYYLYATISANGQSVTRYSLNPLTLTYYQVSYQADTLITTESGDVATLSVTLNKQPTDYVRVKAQVSDISEAEILPAELIFTPTNWQTPQDFVVQGIDDGIYDGDVAYQVVFDNVESADPHYHGFTLDAIELTNIGDGVFTPVVDIELQKNLLSSSPFQVGNQIQYELIISNHGPNDATGIVVSDTMTNLTLVSTSGASCLPADSFPCTIDDLANGQSVTLNVTTQLSAAGTFDNEASAFAAEDDADESNNTDNTDNGGVSVGPNLAVSINVCEQNIQPVQSVVYQLEVSNIGDLDINAAALTSTTSSHLNVQSWECSAINGASCASATGSGNINTNVDLPIGSSLVYLLLTDINAQVGEVINHSASIAMPTGITDVDPSDNSASQSNLITDIIFKHGFELMVNPCQ